MLGHAWCAALAQDIRQHDAVSRLIPRTHVAVQCTFFEKSLHQNWLVPLHQDVSIAVAHRVQDDALQGWSEKEGVLYVQPPASVLESLVAVRLHLDPCGVQDGPLRVVAGSHRLGVLSPEEAMRVRDRHTEVVCPVNPAGAILMRPLLLHASSKAQGNSHRRVLHFVFGPPTLPYGLRWQIAIPLSADAVVL